MLKLSRRGHVTYFWNFGTPPYLGNEVYTAAVDQAILSKFSFERGLNIAIRVLLLNPTPGVDFQLYTAAIFKNSEIDMTS